MIDIRQIDNFLYCYNEANKLGPSLLEEKLGMLYSNYSPPHASANIAEGKVIFETSFASYSRMKVYI